MDPTKLALKALVAKILSDNAEKVKEEERGVEMIFETLRKTGEECREAINNMGGGGNENYVPAQELIGEILMEMLGAAVAGKS